MDKKEIENAKKKVESFKEDLKPVLKELLSKHNFGVKEDCNYNDVENYIGSDYYPVIDGKTYYIEDIAEPS
jgi:hypothetical protein